MISCNYCKNSYLPPLKLPCGRTIRPILTPPIWSNNDNDCMINYNDNPPISHSNINNFSDLDDSDDTFITKKDKFTLKKVKPEEVFDHHIPPDNLLKITRYHSEESILENNNSTTRLDNEKACEFSLLLGNVNKNPLPHDILKNIIVNRKLSGCIFTEPNVNKANFDNLFSSLDLWVSANTTRHLIGSTKNWEAGPFSISYEWQNITIIGYIPGYS
ncbi:unnamed protein product [Bemisia tabaci]|uniref:Uncharacterized protein n=1 Tax=Bemisia tabaci TaxID=7038 RepID=A0A9P0AN54_BEMTA|nr:unnamed protein product [Bemisia tabaci]